MTEHAFYRSLNIRIHDYRSIDSKEIVGWPRVNAQCEYLKPVKFDDVVQIKLFVLKMTDKSIQYRFRFYTTYNDVNKLVATGHITVVCVAYIGSAVRPKAIPIPPNIREKIEVSQDA